MPLDFDIPLPASLEIETSMPIDEAIEIACVKLGLPVLGGPSGRGWSYYSTAQKCPHLYRRTYLDEKVSELRTPAVPLQVGGLYHALQAFFYGAGMGVFGLKDKGISQHTHGLGFPAIPADAADKLLAELKLMADPISDWAASVEGTQPTRKPSLAVIYEAERLFDAHTSYYADKEDLTPLAMEWLAVHPTLNYTCRYDAIFRVGDDDKRFPPGSTVIYERKTSAYITKTSTESWLLDGEILGELLNWKPSGCEELFGPLAGLVVDIVTKGKTPQFLQVIVPANLPAVEDHARWIKWVGAEMVQWEVMGMYPKRFSQCVDKWGVCAEWHNCVRGKK